jgi:Ca2+-binding RTX toxin-like protein
LAVIAAFLAEFPTLPVTTRLTVVDGDDNLYGEDGNDTLNAGNGLDVI